MTKYFNDSAWIFDTEIQLLKYFDDDFLKTMKNINSFLKSSAKNDLQLMIETFEMLQPVLEKVLPKYIDSKNLAIGASLIKELNSLEPGNKTWADYEKLCIKIFKLSICTPI